MFGFLYRRSGVLALGTFFLMLFALFVIQAAYDAMDPKVAAISIIVVMLGGIFAFFAFAVAFLYKAVIAGGESTALGRVGAFGWLVGSSLVAVVFWYMALGIASAVHIGPADITPERGLTYVAEQTLSGMLLDIMEVYNIRISDVTYDPNDYAFATLVLGMRLTGSFVVAALLVKVFARR